MRIVLILIVACLLPSATLAASPTGGDASTITVSGSGDAKGRPTVVEMGATITGEAELAADAVVKFKDSRRRAVKAIEDLKIPALAIESRGFTLSQGMDPNQQQMMMRGQVATNVKSRVVVTEPLRLIIRGVDQMKDEDLMNTVLKVIDAGKDAGLTVGPPSPTNYYQYQMMMNRGETNTGIASFKIENATDLREQAYAKAIENARSKAERLAKLSGVKLGRVVSVQDGATPQNPNQVVYAAYYPGQQGGGDAELASPVAGDITLNVRLTVQFAIE